MLLSGFFVIILVILRTSVALEVIPHDSSCLPFQNTPMKQLCKGTYTTDLFLRYQDRLAAINGQYKIFYHNQGAAYFLLVSFNESPLQWCNSTILIDDSLDFYCGGSRSPLLLPGSMIYCQIYQMSYIDDLVHECTNPKISNFPTSDGSTAVHYGAISRWSTQDELEFGLGLHSAAEGHPGPYRFLAVLICLTLALLSK
ncbi:uncharacterized protein LOC117579422 [Drosophila guanche]|uniref:Uncharacterized protein n=1 Tax=Drosophila guanche TaxID=7266 RepID=A0A3B0J4D7_DROGU|nr:uncharacterized protein LOC117579422 [Drosophila guanche]SPP76335.1 Hypothetical predicted protein [Drosophila guanche]